MRCAECHEEIEELVDEKEHETRTELVRAKNRKAAFEAEKEKEEDIEKAKEFLKEYREDESLSNS